MSDQPKNTNLKEHDLVELPGFSCLGSGYDIFGDYAAPDSLQKQVFDLTPFLADKEKDITSFNGRNYRFPDTKPGLFNIKKLVKHVFQAAAGKNIHTFKEDMSISLHGDGVLEAFTGSLSISNDSSVYKRTSFAYSVAYCLDKNYSISVDFYTSDTPEDDKVQASPYLVDLFKERMDRAQTVQDGLEIMKEYGTHVVVKLFVGKRSVQYASTRESLYKKTNDFKLLAKASLAETLNLEFDYQDKQAVEDFKSESQIKVRRYGTDTQNTMVGFPASKSLIPLWKIYKDNNACISTAFYRLKKTYKFITSLIGRNEKIVTGIDFSYDPYKLRERGYDVFKKDGSAADLRENLGGEYIYMGTKKSSVLEVLQGAKPVVKIIKTISDSSHPKHIEDYTPIHCDFLQSVSYSYEFTYYKQIDLSMSDELTDLLKIGLSGNYDSIREQAFIFAEDDDKFDAIEKGLSTLEALEEKEKQTYSDFVFSSQDAFLSMQYIEHICNPYSVEHYTSRGYKIISDNLVHSGMYGNYLYILGKPTDANV